MRTAAFKLILLTSVTVAATETEKDIVYEWDGPAMPGTSILLDNQTTPANRAALVDLIVDLDPRMLAGLAEPTPNVGEIYANRSLAGPIAMGTLPKKADIKATVRLPAVAAAGGEVVAVYLVVPNVPRRQNR